MSSPLLTYSRLATVRRCPRKGYFRYELGLTRDVDADYFRLGKAFHRGLELHGQGHGADAAIEGATESYDTVPASLDPYTWDVERAKVVGLLAGHFWRYENDDLRVTATELPWRMPLRNPDTGAASRTFELAGKIDALAQLPDGRLAVLEYKTAGEDVGPKAAYWLRLRGDAQISMYMLAARALGYDIATVLYDVTRKPTIKPRQIPLLDEDDQKVVLDADGHRVLTKQGKPRQTSDTALGYVLQTRPESAAEFGQRLLDDIGKRPDYYHQRREVPRLHDDLRECEYELWQQAQQLAEMRRHSRWYRNVTPDNCNRCQFANLCQNNVHVDPAQPPSGYTVMDNVHPELEELFNDDE
jgi:hypothetical protein